MSRHVATRGRRSPKQIVKWLVLDYKSIIEDIYVSSRYSIKHSVLT